MINLLKFPTCGRTFFSLIAFMTLVGCTTLQKQQNMSIVADAMLEEHGKLLAQFDALRLEMPSSDKIEIDINEAWLLQEVNIDYSHQGFREVLVNMMPGYPIVFDEVIENNFNPTVVASRTAKTLRDHLDSLSIQANLAWTSSNGVIFISPTMTKTYGIPIYGAYSSEGEGLSTNITISHDNLGSVETGSGDFENSVSGELSPYQELASLVTSVTGASSCEAKNTSLSDVKAIASCFSISGAGNILTLTTTPRSHASFLGPYENWYNQVNAQVQLVLRVLLFDVTDIAQQGLDVSLLRSAAISAIGGTNSPGFVSFDESANGLTFTFNEDNRYQGSQIIMRALNQIGKTYVIDTKEIIARNNQVASLFHQEITPYLESVAIQQVNSGSTSLSTPTFVTSETITGQAINFIPSITGNSIGLRMIINESVLGDNKVFNFSSNGSVLRSERFATSGTGITFNRTLQDGQIALLTSTNRITIDVDNASNAFLPVVGDLNSAKNRTYTTLYLIEANIVH